MKKPFKNHFSPVVLISAMTLAGCSNVLYSEKQAPVYSGTQSKRGNAVEPAIINSTLTPVPAASTITTRSIERPSNMSVQSTNTPYTSSGAAKVTPAPKVVNTAPTRPSTATSRVQATTNNPIKRATQPVTSSVAQPKQTTPVVTQTVNNRVNQPVQRTETKVNEAVTASAQAAASTDSRIKEATSVLNTPATVEKTTTEVVSRPSATAATASKKTTATANTVTKKAAAVAPVVKKTATVNKAPEKAAAASNSAKAVAKKPVAKKTPSATTALLQEARSAVGSGNYDKAASALERAHRIEPGNAKILYDIAQIRYAQGKYSQAESFASKAATLSKSSGLSKKTWSLLSNARKALGNTIGAETAAKKAASF